MSQLLLAQIDHTLSVIYSIHINIYVDSCQNRATAYKYHIAISKARVVVPKSYRPKGQPRNTRDDFPIQPLFFLRESSKTRETSQWHNLGRPARR